MRTGKDSPVKMHADRVIVLNVLVEEAFHQSMSSQRLFDFALHTLIDTLRPIFVLISIGRKYFTSLGLKNIYLTVALLLLIL